MRISEVVKCCSVQVTYSMGSENTVRNGLLSVVTHVLYIL